MARSEFLDWVDLKDFKGLESPNALPSVRGLTRDMVNVHIEEGSILPRPGAATFQNADHDEEVTRFFDYNHLGTIHLLRFSLTGIQEWNGTAWADLTLSTGFTAAAGDNVGAAMFKDDLYVIPQPAVKPYKWTAASGTVTQDAGAVTGRDLMNYSGFLHILYADGDPRGIRFSADGSTWTVTDVLTMEDSPGFILRGLPWQGVGYIYKNISIDFIKFRGSGTTTFAQDNLTMDVGLGAFNTLGEASGLGHFFLGNDGRLYLNNGQLNPILKRISDRIRSEINMANLSQSFASIDPTRNLYTLFYPVLSDTYSFRKMDINYLHGTATVDNYELLGTGTFARGAYTRYGSVAPFFVMSDASSAPLTYRLDTSTQLTDNSKVITHYWTTDWIEIRGKQMEQVQITIKHRGRGRLKILASDEIGTTYDLLGTHSAALDTKSFKIATASLSDRIAGEDIIELGPIGIKSDHVKFRIEFEPETNHDDIKLMQFSMGFKKDER